MKNKKIKKFLIYTFAAFVLYAIFLFLYFNHPKLITSFDNKIQDIMFLIRGKIKDTNNVVIIDIDEKSLNSLGQWPWSRDKLAKILANLTNAGVAAIGLDIVFAEKDRTSPALIFKKFNIKFKNPPNYDEIFANIISQTPTILGYQFELEDKKFLKQGEINIPAIIIEKNKPANLDLLIDAKGVILNIPKIQEVAYSSGFFNNIPDDSGVIRRVPLIIRYQDQLYPSLALELLRALSGINKIIINYNELGITNLQIGDMLIPTDKFGRLFVNFRGPEGSFKYISAVDIYNNNFDLNLIKNKIVIIGTTAAGLKDLRATPFESIYPGVEVHANVIDNIIKGDFLTFPYWIDLANIVILFFVIFITIYSNTYTPFWFNPVALIIIAISLFIGGYYALFYKGIVLNIFLPILATFVATLLATFMDYIFEIRQEHLIKQKFATKVSKEVMEDILKDLDVDKFRANTKEITIFFSDVRNFTNISETLSDAKLLIEFLNQYMDPMTKIITKYKGTVDKYIGDAIMAYWNAPNDIANHTEKAVIASLEQLHKVKELNIKYQNQEKFKNLAKMAKEKNIPILDIGIGLNVGEAVVGEMGSNERSDYTAIGDSVNLASRMEALCKYYNSKLNITNFVKEKLDQDKFIFRFLDLVTVKGKTEPVEIWQIIDYDRSEKYPKLYDVTKEELLQEIEVYHNAVKFYKMQRFEEALEMFKNLQNYKNKTNKNIYNIYIERCEHYIANPPKDFNGVFVHTTKG